MTNAKYFIWTTKRFDQMEEEAELEKYENTNLRWVIFWIIFLVIYYFGLFMTWDGK